MPPEMMGSQLVGGKWRIESLQDQHHQDEARRRYDYVSLMPKLALFCLFADFLYLSYRILLVKRALRVDSTAYVALLIELFFAGCHEPIPVKNLLTVGSNVCTSAPAVSICLGKS